MEKALAQQLAISHAVQCHPAGKAEIFLASFSRDGLTELEHDLLSDSLDRRGEIHLPLCEWRFGLPGRRTEQVVEALVGHGEAGAIVEVVEVQAEAAVFLDVNKIILNGPEVLRLPVWG